MGVHDEIYSTDETNDVVQHSGVSHSVTRGKCDVVKIVLQLDNCNAILTTSKIKTAAIWTRNFSSALVSLIVS